MMRMPTGAVGVVVFLLLLLVAFLGPLAAPHSPGEVVGLSSQGPAGGLPLGTDYLGRDVLSRVLEGGRSVVLIGLSSTLIAHAIGTLIGIFAGYSGGLRDAVLMRTVDLLLTVPSILVLLLLAGALGRHVWVLVIGVVFVQFPAISRVMRTAALSVSRMGYVEAAQARGDRVTTIWRRDILPNILPNLLADFGIRFSISILLVAGLNYLGLGLSPPAADWGLMTSENQATISLNVWAVVVPALMLAILGVSINLIADSYLRSVGRSGPGRRPRGSRPRPRVGQRAGSVRVAADAAPTASGMTGRPG